MLKEKYENKVLVIKEEVKDEDGNVIGITASIINERREELGFEEDNKIDPKPDKKKEE